MKVTAILAIRNEEAYLANCLRHLVSNDVNFVVIDNGSSDSSREICRRSEFAGNLVDVVDFPFDGSFSITKQLSRKMEVIGALETDWVIHLDADEVMHSYRQGETLNEALSRADALGWNVVNFNEFVFLPIDHDYVPEAQGHQPILHYYFFEPYAPRLMRAWKKACGFSMVEGGHRLTGSDLKIAPEHLALRHYIVRSQEHALTKYTTRTFAADDLARGWHQVRRSQSRDGFRFPPAEVLCRLPFAGCRTLDRTAPWKVHYWNRGEFEPAAGARQAGIKQAG
jgi:glycosyltransferase involved in cell wall biosynthesis